MSVQVRPAFGNWDGFYEVVGVKKPGGHGCWCMAYRDSRVSNDDRPGYMRHECETEPGPGVLAYLDGEPAGWCSVAPRSSYRRLLHSRTIPSPSQTGLDEDADPWSVVCFVIRPAFRRRGLMHDLLRGAVAHAAAHGAQAIEGYPILSDPAADGRPARVDVISAYVGTTALFEAEGFTRVVETRAHSGHQVRWLMRRDLREPGEGRSQERAQFQDPVAGA